MDDEIDTKIHESCTSVWSHWTLLHPGRPMSARPWANSQKCDRVGGQKVPQTTAAQRSKISWTEDIHLISTFVWAGAGMTITVPMYQNITFTIMWDLLLCFSWAIYAPEKDSEKVSLYDLYSCVLGGRMGVGVGDKWAITMEQSLR